MLHGAIDCDRIDYLQRDAHYTGVAHGAIDAVRLLATVRKFHGRLAFHEKGRSALEGFLVGRALMYSSVYYHKTVRAAEVMMQSAVERLPGYPWIARSLLELTDGELLCGLAHREDRSSRLIHGLLERRLFKRIWGASKLSPAKRARWARVSKNPPIRRGVEDELAEAVGLPPGGLLLDLAGIDTRDPGGRDWAQVLVVEDGAAVRPFRANSLWRSLVLRPPTLTPLAVYVDPKFRNLPQEKISRAVDRLS
jgi:HD superfamily phosphohydrolase